MLQTHRALRVQAGARPLSATGAWSHRSVADDGIDIGLCHPNSEHASSCHLMRRRVTWSQRRQSASHFVQRLSKTQALRSYAFYLAQPSRPRSQRWAGSASNRGCQSNQTVTSDVWTGRTKLCITSRRFPVCRSGTLAIRSDVRARASARRRARCRGCETCSRTPAACGVICVQGSWRPCHG